MRTRDLEFVLKYLLDRGVETFDVNDKLVKCEFYGANEKEKIRITLFDMGKPPIMEVTVTETIG